MIEVMRLFDNFNRFSDDTCAESDSVVGLRTMLQTGRSRISLPIKSLDLSTDLIFPASVVLGSTQPLTEMSTRNLPWGKGWLARKADNLTVICEPVV
jgi:hypothetical protein